MNNNYNEITFEENFNMEASTYCDNDLENYYEDYTLNFFGVCSNLTYSNLDIKSYEN